MSPADILRRAKAELEKPGTWTQGGGDDFVATITGCQCMVTAVKFASHEDLSLGSHFRLDRALAALGLAVGIPKTHVNPGVPIGRWNDQPGRTLEQVLEAFDRAIASLEAAS